MAMATKTRTRKTSQGKTKGKARKAQTETKPGEVIDRLSPEDVAKLEALATQAQENIREWERQRQRRRKKKKALEKEGLPPEEIKEQIGPPPPSPPLAGGRHGPRRDASEVLAIVKALVEHTDPLEGTTAIARAQETLREQGISIDHARLSHYLHLLQEDGTLWEKLWNTMRIPLLETMTEAHSKAIETFVARISDPQQWRFDSALSLARASDLIFNQMKAVAGADVVRQQVEVKDFRPKFIEVQPIDDEDIKELKGEDQSEA